MTAAALAVLVMLACGLAPVAPLGPAYAGSTATQSKAGTPTAWDERGSLVLPPDQALAALDRLPADSPAAVSWAQGGSRTGGFGEAWQDVDGDGCDTRNEVLARDLSDADFSRASGLQTADQGRGEGASVCPDATVWTGVLHDPYTGKEITFQRGQDTSAAVQIDHVVPLNYLYAHGAWAWDQRTRLLVANDPLNLLAVDGEANSAKGACGPATCPVGTSETGTWTTASGSGWWPPDPGFHCEYAQRFVSVLAAYRLGVPDADRQALAEVLGSCTQAGDGQVSWLKQLSGLRPGVLARATARPPVALPLGLGLALTGGALLLWHRRRR